MLKKRRISYNYVYQMPPRSSATPELVVQGAVRKQAEQTAGSQPVSSLFPRLLLQFLCPGSCLGFPERGR